MRDSYHFEDVAIFEELKTVLLYLKQIYMSSSQNIAWNERLEIEEQALNFLQISLEKFECKTHP